MRTEKFTSVARWMGKGVAVLLMAVGLTVGIILYQILSRADTDRAANSRRQLFCFSTQFSIWWVTHRRIPGPDLADAVREMMQDKLISETLSRECRDILEGRDAWGRPFVYEVDPTGKSAVLRSVGPNGKDDGGSSDDVQVKLIGPNESISP